jgi:hypothetical protein
MKKADVEDAMILIAVKAPTPSRRASAKPLRR